MKILLTVCDRATWELDECQVFYCQSCFYLYNRFIVVPASTHEYMGTFLHTDIEY